MATIELLDHAESVDLEEFAHGKDVYALRVADDSLRDEFHLCRGDQLIVKNRRQAQDGELVVALLDDGAATVKEFAQGVNVMGVVIGMVRKH